MTALRLKIMIKAALLRMNAGEELEDILTGWPALTEPEKEQIRSTIVKG